MEDKKNIIVFKESLFARILNKIKGVFGIKSNTIDIPKNNIPINNIKESSERPNNNFIPNLKVKNDSDIIYLKMKLDNHEIKAIDLTDEQLDKLLEIYTKELLEKREKIIRLKST